MAFRAIQGKGTTQSFTSEKEGASKAHTANATIIAHLEKRVQVHAIQALKRSSAFWRRKRGLQGMVETSWGGTGRQGGREPGTVCTVGLSDQLSAMFPVNKSLKLLWLGIWREKSEVCNVQVFTPGREILYQGFCLFSLQKSHCCTV